MRRPAAFIAVLLAGLASAAPSLAAPRSPAGRQVARKLARFPTPPGCAPVPLGQITGGPFCTQALLVTSTNNTDGDTFTVTDGNTTRAGRVSGGNPAWYNSYTWSLGPMTAGQVVTLWGRVDPSDPSHMLQVTRWIERTHGSPSLRGRFSPTHPYGIYTGLDIASGHVPENRMVWSLLVPFLELPQTHEIGGDGDVHIQTMLPCPTAGVTTETVPELLGYVDTPYLLPAYPDPTDDAPKQEMRQAPPIGVPIVMLGGVRYDPGYGWWELHPVRAWRFPSPAELQWAAAQCQQSPVPQLDSSSLAFPIPYGAPSCGQSPVAGDQLMPVTDALAFKPCGPVCQVSATAIDRPETLGPASLCAEEGIKPIADHSQLDGSPAPIPAALGSAPSGGAVTGESDAGPGEHEDVPAWLDSPSFLSQMAQAYCAQPLPANDGQGDPFYSCRHR